MKIPIVLADNDNVTIHRVVPIRFSRATKGAADALRPDLDDRGFRPGLSCAARGPAIGMVNEEQITIRVVRDRIASHAKLFIGADPPKLLKILSPEEGNPLAADHVQIRAIAPEALRDQVEAKLQVRYGRTDGPIVAEMSVWIYKPLRVPVKVHAVDVNWTHGSNTIPDRITMTEGDVAAILRDVNHVYAQAGIAFVPEGGICRSTFTTNHPRMDDLTDESNELQRKATAELNQQRARLQGQGRWNTQSMAAAIRGLQVKYAPRVNRINAETLRLQGMRTRPLSSGDEAWLRARANVNNVHQQTIEMLCRAASDAMNVYVVPRMKRLYGTGYNRWAVGRNYIPYVSVVLSRETPKERLRAHVASHEFGHVLGLRHYAGGENEAPSYPREDFWANRNLMFYSVGLHKTGIQVLDPRIGNQMRHPNGVACRMKLMGTEIEYGYRGETEPNPLMSGLRGKARLISVEYAYAGSAIGRKWNRRILQSAQVYILRRSVRERLYVPVPQGPAFFQSQW